MTLAGAGRTVIGGAIADSAVADPDASGLTVSGPGTVELTGSNSYSGNTAVTGGTLLLNGTNSGIGTVTIANGAAIGGTGTLAGDLVLDQGAQLVFNGLALNVSGSVMLDSSFGIHSLIGLGPDTEEDEYFLFTGTSTNFAALGIQNWGIENAASIGGGKSAYFDTGSLKLVVIPEPHTIGLLLAAGALLTLRRRS